MGENKYDRMLTVNESIRSLYGFHAILSAICLKNTILKIRGFFFFCINRVRRCYDDYL